MSAPSRPISQPQTDTRPADPVAGLCGDWRRENQGRFGRHELCQAAALCEVTLPSQFGLSISGNLFVPNDIDRNARHRAIVIGHPMGAIKEQSATLYAARLAELGFVTMAVDLPVELPADADPVTAMYHEFYRTRRGIATPTGRKLMETQNHTMAGEVKFLNFYPFNDIETISPRPILIIAGNQAHSRAFSEAAYARAAEPRELQWIEGANPIDLYDNPDLIPFDRLRSFREQRLA